MADAAATRRRHSCPVAGGLRGENEEWPVNEETPESPLDEVMPVSPLVEATLASPLDEAMVLVQPSWRRTTFFSSLQTLHLRNEFAHHDGA